MKKLSAYKAEFVDLAHALKVKVAADSGTLKAVRNLAISPDAFATT